MPGLFGTDGIRAVAGSYPLDEGTIWKVGHALASGGWKSVLTARDTRASGPWIQEWLDAGIRAGGGACTSVGVIPTPGLAYLVGGGEFDAGVMISASHNPFRDNGIKIFSGAGTKLDDAAELALEESILGAGPRPPDRLDGHPVSTSGELQTEYLAFLESSLAGTRLEGLRVAIDAANGAGYQLAPLIFRRLGATVVETATNPDGTNINQDCGALHPEGLAELVTRQSCHLGLALDGDADRAILADSRGRIIDGDYLLLILAREMRDRGRLESRSVVGTVMANMGLEVALRQEGIDLIRTRVGDRYVLEEMVRGGHQLGGEQSGHIILRHLSAAGDGILVGLQVAAIMAAGGRSLEELSQGLEKYPQTLINIPVGQKPDFMEIPVLRAAVRGAEAELAGRGRVLIRYSGTEPKLRVMVEGPDLDQIGRLSQELAALFQRELG